jgi:Zn-dependent protease
MARRAEPTFPTTMRTFCSIEAPARADPGERGLRERWRETTGRSGDRRFLWLALLLVGIVAKLKIVLSVLVKGKLFAPAFSMLASIGAYALVWGLPFAAGLVLLLFVHELGHALELRRQGVKASLPFFIPFLGALIALKEMPRDAYREARMAIAGPILGSLGALVVYLAALASGSQLLQALAFTGFFLNLFNLVPVVPLDGGRIVAAVSIRFWLVGLAGLVAFTVAFGDVFFLLVFALLGGPELLRRWQARRSPESARYHAVPSEKRLAIGAAYVLLLVSLLALCGVSYVELPR